MARMIALWSLVAICSSGYGQVITIVDQKNDEPMEFVTITSNKPPAFTTTNAAGQADISAFIGAQHIEIRYIGYTVEVVTYDQLEASGFVVRLAPSGIFLDQVVISASRWSQRAREVPARIATISAQEMALQNPQTAADLLSMSGEVFVQKSQQGGGSPMIRGFATNRLLYAVDGVRMNTAIFRSGNLQNVISLDPFATEHTEIVFGPGSVIYGSDAIGGVMSFTTLTPQFSYTGEPLITGSAVARFASANQEKTIHFNVNAGWNRWSLLTSFSTNDYGDLRMGRHGPDDYLKTYFVQRQDNADVVVTNDDPLVQRPTGYQQVNLMQKVRFMASNRWDFQLALHYSTTTDYARYDRLLRLQNGLPRSAEWNYGPQEWMMNNLNITHTGSNQFFDQLSIRLAHQYFAESRVDRDLNAAVRFHRNENVHAYSLNLDFHKDVNQRHKFFYGAEIVYDDVESIGIDEDIVTGEMEIGPSRYPQSSWLSYGAYLSYQYRFSDRAILHTGLRYNRYDLDADFSNNLPFYPFPFETAEVNNGSVTGSLGFVYNPNADWTLSANLSTGFRSPNVDDIGKVFDSEPGSVVIPNPDLDAEYVYNAELDIARVFGERLRVDVTGFYTSLKDALVRRDATLNGQDSILYNGELSQVQSIQNAASARVYGVQASLELKVGGGFSILSKLNYQEGEEELDDGTNSPLRHAAPWYGVTWLKFTTEGLDMQFNVSYSGKVSYEDLSEEGRGTPYIFALDENGNPYSPGWFTLNFKASCPISEVLMISGGVENILDKRYRPYSSGLTAAGRNVILSLRAKF